MAVIVIFFVGLAMTGQGYINDINAAKKHVEGFSDRERYYSSIIANQQAINATQIEINKNLKSELSSIKTELKFLSGEMMRLKLVSYDPDDPQKIAENKNM
jgi:hypothetical protein